MDDQPFMQLTGITKSFGGIQALSDVSLSIRRGTVHAFVGENGAGKSTLARIISGIHVPDAGHMVVEGRRVSFASPREALKAGIATIQQEIALVPHLSVLENVFLGRETSFLGFLVTRNQSHEFAHLVRSTGFNIDPNARVSELRLADQQKVEMLRAIARRSKLIVFDEPTAALTPDETSKLLRVIHKLRESGTTVVYVSHHLDEIFRAADYITVLRNGRLVTTTSAATQNPASLVKAMLGRSQDAAFPKRKTQYDGPQDIVLELDGLTRSGAFNGVSFAVKRGEIVCIAGLVGSGRSELLRGIFGADQITGGSVVLDGQRHRTMTPARSMRLGLGMIPESRKDQGMLPRRSVAENVTIGHLHNMVSAGFVKRRKEKRIVERLIALLDARPAAPDFPIGLMSGGNQQKVMLAKWLVGEPKVLLIDEPTRGVDVGGKFTIYEQLFDLAAEGLALVIVSSEVEEVLGLADRVLVIRRGGLALDADRLDVDKELVMRAAFGATERPDDGTPDVFVVRSPQTDILRSSV